MKYCFLIGLDDEITVTEKLFRCIFNQIIPFADENISNMSKIMDVELVVIKFRQAYGKTPDARSRYCGKTLQNCKLQLYMRQHISNRQRILSEAFLMKLSCRLRCSIFNPNNRSNSYISQKYHEKTVYCLKFHKK